MLHRPYSHLSFPLLLLAILLSIRGVAQSTDSLQQQLSAFPSDTAKVHFLEQQIDSLSHVQPALAMKYVQVADSILQSMDSLAWKLEIQRLKAVVLREIAEFNQAQMVLEEALKTLPASHSSATFSALEARLHISLAVVYRRQGDLPRSVAESQLAIRQLDSLVAVYPDQTDYRAIQSDAYNGLAITYGRMGNYGASNRYFHLSLQIDEQLGDQESMQGVLFNIGSNFYLTEQYDSAEYYWLSVINEMDTTSENFMSDAIYQNLGLLAAEQKQWDKATQYYQQALRLYLKRGNQADAASIYQSLAYMHNEQGKYALARQEALTGLSVVGQALREKSILHQQLADAYQGMGQYQSAAENYRTYANLQDSLLNREKTEAIAEMEAKYQHEQQQKELALQRQQIELLHQDNQIRQLERNMLALGCLLLLVLGILIIRVQRLKVKRKQEQLRNSQALVATIQENARLKEEKLRQELEHRNQQLTSYTLNFIQKNELMNELQEKVEGLQQQKQWSPRDFRQLRTHIQQHVSIDQDWENFKLHFESVHPDFFHNLTSAFPDLGPKELKLCALIRLNLNIKESAVVLGISPDSVKTARHRLRKKMALEYEESMLDVLMQVEKGTYAAESLEVS